MADPASGEKVEKAVFVVFFAGERAKIKILKARACAKNKREAALVFVVIVVLPLVAAVVLATAWVGKCCMISGALPEWMAGEEGGRGA